MQKKLVTILAGVMAVLLLAGLIVPALMQLFT